MRSFEHPAGGDGSSLPSRPPAQFSDADGWFVPSVAPAASGDRTGGRRASSRYAAIPAQRCHSPE